MDGRREKKKCSWKENLTLRFAPQTDDTMSLSLQQKCGVPRFLAEKEHQFSPLKTHLMSRYICGLMQLLLQPLQIKTHQF